MSCDFYFGKTKNPIPFTKQGEYEYLVKGEVQIVHALVVNTTNGMQKMKYVNTEKDVQYNPINKSRSPFHH